METGAAPKLTNLLVAWRGGDAAALEKLMPLVYSELRRIAEHYLRRERSDHTLQPTALIHEAYLKLAQGGMPDWQNRAHFFGVASRIMRQVLVDWARRNCAGKRGGEAAKVNIDDAIVMSPDRGSQLLALDDSLTALAQFDERGCRAVEMKYFGGLSLEEIAEALGISIPTVSRDLRSAEAWLKRELAAPSAGTA
jgi:RNA polymerase sigma-70 factor, ECF subfamily